MSDHKYSGSNDNSGLDPSQDATQKHAETTKQAYEAPYHPAEQYPIPGSYMVGFFAGHIIAKHFAFLGCEFEFGKWGLEEKQGYSADMDDALLKAVRNDPGVELVCHNASGERE
ncbi:hypothetical protein EJ08DRAFT_653738 [Tothia fuscella]|uniref:Uncharacterized protein n=1 Tax=Tothia fuscella TaxID=1048955 RepID=A0A9P4NGV9_9PEZI|nr:hypothetical protein EJ08DRAFT_653738 [Tothia fuscella]